MWCLQPVSVLLFGSNKKWWVWMKIGNIRLGRTTGERKIGGTFESSDRTVSSRSTAFEWVSNQVGTKLHNNQMKLKRFNSQAKTFLHVIHTHTKWFLEILVRCRLFYMKFSKKKIIFQAGSTWIFQGPSLDPPSSCGPRDIYGKPSYTSYLWQLGRKSQRLIQHHWIAHLHRRYTT